MLTRAAVLFVCLVASAAFIARSNHSEPVMPRAALDTFPVQIGEWNGRRDPPVDKEVLDVLGADDYTGVTYLTPDRAGISLFVAYYASQREGDTMHSPLNCLPGAGWEPLSKGTLTIPVAESAGAPAATRPISVNRYVIQKGLDRLMVIYWYQSHGRIVASEYWGKFYLLKDSIALNRTDGALVRVIAAVPPDDPSGEATAESLAVRFVQSMFPLLSRYLPA